MRTETQFQHAADRIVIDTTAGVIVDPLEANVDVMPEIACPVQSDGKRVLHHSSQVDSAVLIKIARHKLGHTWNRFDVVPRGKTPRPHPTQLRLIANRHQQVQP